MVLIDEVPGRAGPGPQAECPNFASNSSSGGGGRIRGDSESAHGHGRRRARASNVGRG